MSTVKILIESHGRLGEYNRSAVNISALQEGIYYSIIRDCKSLGGNVIYQYLGGMITIYETGNLDSTIHVEIDRKDAPTFMRLIKENRSDIVSLKYI
jgi:hypothetical protein